MDAKDRKLLEANTRALEANTKAQEEANRLTSAVLKASGKQAPQQAPMQPAQQIDPALKNIKNW